MGEALTHVGGDAQLLDERMRARVQRIDRAIQTAEKENDRGSRRVLRGVPAGWDTGGAEASTVDTAGWCADRVRRFTMTTHAVHELEAVIGEQEVIFEMETTRGMYLGRSDSVDDTAHLLPRGIQWDVIGAHEGRYQRPDGTLSRCRIVQLREVVAEAGEQS
ncbi:hypothetical protein GS489_07490 [Rhodococcus hoagii]|nr:hypothetical protein [Prescottella equi]